MPVKAPVRKYGLTVTGFLHPAIAKMPEWNKLNEEGETLLLIYVWSPRG